MKNLILLSLVFLLFAISCKTSYAGIILNTPEVSPMISVTEYKITYFEVDIPSTSVIVNYDKLSGALVIGSEIMVLQGAEFAEVLSIKPDGTKTIYENLASILYSRLKAKTGVVGSIQ